MSTSAGGGGPGRGPAGTMKSLQMPVKGGKVAWVVTASVVAVYAFWELRIRASRELGQIPVTLNQEWQQAEVEYMRHAPITANPSKFVYLNPFRHNIPPSKAIIVD